MIKNKKVKLYYMVLEIEAKIIKFI